jgi:hypothetical protein
MGHSFQVMEELGVECDRLGVRVVDVHGESGLASDFLATVARYIEAREKELLGRRWIPISESLPQSDDGTPVATFLVWNRTDVIQAWREKDGRFTGVTGEHIPRVTHWMPMPAPPTDAK